MTELKLWYRRSEGDKVLDYRASAVLAAEDYCMHNSQGSYTYIIRKELDATRERTATNRKDTPLSLLDCKRTHEHKQFLPH